MHIKLISPLLFVPLLLWRALNSGPAKWLVVIIPFIWLLCFLAMPLLEILQISFTTQTRVVQPLFHWTDTGLVTNFNLNAYIDLIYDTLFKEWTKTSFINPFWQSLRLSFVSTLLILSGAYPIAYWIATSPPRTQLVLLILVLLPFWTPGLLRIYSLIGLMRSDGFINQTMMVLGVIEQPLKLRGSDLAIYYGMFITYLPLMVLPIYAVLSRLNHRLNEAAADLGANSFTVFWTITWPLSLPGVIAGCVLVFVPAFGEYMVPTLLGNPDHKMMGAQIWEVYAKQKYWPGASALAVILMVVLVLPVILYQIRSEEKNEEKQNQSESSKPSETSKTSESSKPSETSESAETSNTREGSWKEADIASDGDKK